MSSAYKPVWVLFAVLCGVTIVSVLSKATARKEIVPWRTDFAAARREAAEQGKPVFAYFTASWCGPCQSLKSTTWADAKVEAALRGYVPVKIDIDARSDLAGLYRVNAVPTMSVLRADGGAERSISGALAPADLLGWLGPAPAH